MGFTAGTELGGRSVARSAWLTASLAMIAMACTGPAGAVAAKAPVSAISVAPANPLGSKSIIVRWYADRAPRPGRTYRVEMRIDGEGGACRSFASANVAPTWRRGATVSTTLRVNRKTGRAWWCTGTAVARVIVSSRGSGTTLARALFEVRDDPSSPTPNVPFGTPVKIDLLAGSAMTVRVAGRPDRSAPLSGTLRGFLPGRFVPNSDLVIDGMSGTVTVAGLPPDPLCPPNGRPSTTSFDLTKLSSMVLLASGSAIFTFVPSEELLGVAGCQGPAAAFTRSFVLGARVGPAGLVNLPMTGSIGDVPMNDGSAASITVSIVARIDLSGR